jgi:hypothetical protein
VPLSRKAKTQPTPQTAAGASDENSAGGICHGFRNLLAHGLRDLLHQRRRYTFSRGQVPPPILPEWIALP